jgi:cytoskeletal protein CcmA (bactofilin family)
MVHKKIFIGLVAVFIATAFFMVGIVGAHEIRTGDSIVTTQNEVIDETLFAFGKTLDISSTVNGDVICAGQTVNISGTVKGDVICAAQTLNISGNVDGDIRLAGQTITITGMVDGNATLASQSVTIQSDGEITGDLSVGAEQITLGGPVGRDVAIGGTNVVLASSVGRDIKGTTENLTLTSNAVIGGDIDYTSKNEIQIDNGAVVEGTVDRTVPENNKTSSATVFGFAIAWFIYIFLALLLTSLVLALVIPGVLQATTDRIMKSPWIAVLIGFIASFTVPVILIFFGITIIGLPLMILFGLIWLVIIMLSGPFSAYYIGRLIMPNRIPIITMLVGSVVLLALYFIPFIGIIALIGAHWLGSGMILQEMFRRNPQPALETVGKTESSNPVKTNKSKKSLNKTKK